MSMIEELDPPFTIQNSNRAMELARIWIVDGRQDVSISSNLWDDPAAWGLMLVDLAKHVANAYENDGKDRDEVFTRILEGFRAELESETDNPQSLD